MRRKWREAGDPSSGEDARMTKPDTSEIICVTCKDSKIVPLLADGEPDSFMGEYRRCPDCQLTEEEWMTREFADAREQQAELPAWLRGNQRE